MWRGMGSRSRAEALSFLTGHYRRRWGLLVVREYARHRVRRVPYIGLARGARAAGGFGGELADAVQPLADAYDALAAIQAHGAFHGA